MASLGGAKPRLGLGEAEALVVKTSRGGQMKGPEGLGDVSDTVLTVADRLTGGALNDLQQQLAELRTYLQISIACSVVTGGLALLTFVSSRRA